MVAALPLSAQTAFEVASIKPATPGSDFHVSSSMKVDKAMVSAANMSLADLIAAAYRLRPFQVTGPSWIGSERYNLRATLPEGASQDQVPEMLQALLKERFKLASHTDKTEQPIYALVVGKNGPKFKESRAKPMTMEDLAQLLTRYMDRPVVDMTSLKGTYQFALELTYHDMMANRPSAHGGDFHGGPGGDSRAGHDDSDSRSIFQRVQDFGLRLDPRKNPMDRLVVDRVERTPTEN